MQSSDVLPWKYGGLPQRSPMFSISGPHPIPYGNHSGFPLPEKSFIKISYISYTNTWNFLYFLTISGEG